MIAETRTIESRGSKRAVADDVCMYRPATESLMSDGTIILLMACHKYVERAAYLRLCGQTLSRTTENVRRKGYTDPRGDAQRRSNNNGY